MEKKIMNKLQEESKKTDKSITEENPMILESEESLSEIESGDIYENVEFLKNYLTEYMKIKPRTVTFLSKKQQAKVSKAIKRARLNRLIPYVRSTSNLEETLQENENKSESKEK